MGALNWLNRLRKNESGNILAIGAAAMPMFVGSAALAVDTIQLSLAKRELQRAADSGAIAGAYSLSQRRPTTDIRNAVTRDLTQNPHPTLVTGGTLVTPGARGGHRQAVHVALTATRDLPFMGMFTGEAATIKADATAALVATGRYCMVALYEGDDAGIVLNGNATVKLGCGMITNSRAASAILSGGTQSWIEATPIGSVGGLDGDRENFDGEGGTAIAQLVPYSAPQADPLAGLGNPEPCSGTAPALDVGANETRTLTEAEMLGCWSSVSVGSNGTLIIPGSLEGTTLKVWGGDVSIHGTLRMAGAEGTGTTIVMSGAANSAGVVSAGTLTMGAQAELNLAAPLEGTLAGILFYRDRRAAASEITIRGGGNSMLKGAFYSPTSDFSYGGNAGLVAECLVMVGQKISFLGTSDLDNSCPADTDYPPVSGSIVRLVE